MSVNCARPGCWHPRDAVQGDYPHYFGHKLDGCHDCDGFNDDDVPSARPCPGYRTQAQQEAWEEIAAWPELSREAIGHFRHADELLRGDKEEGGILLGMSLSEGLGDIEGLPEALERLLELYP